MSSTNSIHYIEDLTPEAISSLTQLLCLHYNSPSPPKSWLIDQETLLSTFSPQLLRPNSLIPRLAMHLPFTPAKAILCSSHKSLNPHLIRRIFMQVSAECTTRVRRLKAHMGSAATNMFPSEVRAFIGRIEKINSLWMAPVIYRTVFKAQPEDERFQRIESGCEACLLAVVGGNKQILSDLRSAADSRRRKRRGPPRLLALLDGWIDWLGDGDRIREESNDLAKHIRRVRKEIQEARRQRRQDAKEGLRRPGKQSKTTVRQSEESDELELMQEHYDIVDGEGEGANEQDFEGSIISFYRDMLSTTSFGGGGSPNPPPEDIHQAFRASFTFSPGTERQYFTAPLTVAASPSPRGTWYSESVYSTDSGVAGMSNVSQNRSYTSTGSKKDSKKAQKYAQAYEALVGIPEASEDWDEDGGMSAEHKSRIATWTEEVEVLTKPERLTRWSDMYRDVD